MYIEKNPSFLHKEKLQNHELIQRQFILAKFKSIDNVIMKL